MLINPIILTYVKLISVKLHLRLVLNLYQLSAEDILDPLLMLYEFGELQCISSIDRSSGPFILIGASTNDITYPNRFHSREPSQTFVNNAVHTIIEGFEPTTGIR